MEVNQVIQGDCLEVMKGIEDKSIDMILCDLPYGTTACKWDTIIPFELLWTQYKRLIKDNGAIVLTGSEPFSSLLRCSNLPMYKYDWVYKKKCASNFAQAKYAYSDKSRHASGEFVGKIKGEYDKENDSGNDELRYPSSVQEFNNRASGDRGFHPTQKPILLFEYFIKTYTNKGELVLDNCAGSGTTGVACKNLGRNYILIEKEEKYVDIATKRINDIPETLF